MKKLLLAVSALLSLNVFAQSYVIMDTGVVITLDRNGQTFDTQNSTVIENLTLKGGQFFVEGTDTLVTIDEAGSLFRKTMVIPEGILGKGSNYFVSEAGDLITTTRQGFVNVTADEQYKAAAFFGGNYFATSTDALLNTMTIFSVNLDGLAVKTELAGIHESEVAIFGGNYFITKKGLVYTVSQDGVVAVQEGSFAGKVEKVGGNFFLNAFGNFFSISAAGVLATPGLPNTLKLRFITKLGSNYFLDMSGRLWSVDTEGNIFERVMVDYDFRDARVISL